jgi:GSCFA family
MPNEPSEAAVDIGRLSPEVGQPHVPKHQWHRQGAKVYPLDKEVFYGDLTQLIADFVLPGHTPREPLLDENGHVITFGSCFAAELRDYLSSSGFSAQRLEIPAQLNNTFALLDFVSWVVTGDETERGFRYERSGTDGKIEEWKPEQEREQVLEGLRHAGAFVFTLGLAEIWEESATGRVFWRGVPKELYDSRRHVFRLSTAAENERNILRMIELIREVNATAPIVLTLSPVPLAATFRDISCVTADCVSKATLRVAIDSVMTRKLDGVYYWPSFEIVRWLGGHIPWPVYGFLHPGNSRHVTRYVVGLIMDAFVGAFYAPAAASELRARAGAHAVSAESAPWIAQFRETVETAEAAVHSPKVYKRGPAVRALRRTRKRVLGAVRLVAARAAARTV